MENSKSLDEMLKDFHEDEKFENVMNHLIKTTVPQIINNVKATEEEKKEMSKRLEEKIRITNRNTVKICVIYEKEEIINKNINIVLEEWNRKTDDEKKSELIYDKEFEKIVSYSNMAWEIARNRAKTGEICQDVEKYNEIKKVLEKDHSDVKEFNKKYIKQYVSEGLLDLDYGFGKAETVSLRVGRYM